MSGDPDDTVRLPPSGGFRGARLLVGAVLGACLVWALVPRGPTPPLVPAAPPPAIVAALPPELDEAALATFEPPAPTMVRLRENPQIFVLLFPDLDAQAASLNRIAALVEKAGLPRDRIVDEAELASFIARQGEQPSTWYVGHDYRGADIARFLSLARAGGVRLSPAEAWAADRYLQARALTPPSQDVALISVANAGGGIDARLRAAILRHEIGHGHFFTRPAIADHVERVWRERFDAAERAAFAAFLDRQGYDTGNAELMANEAMAYLLFTPDTRFFSAGQLGVTEAALAVMREKMRADLPEP